MPICRCEGTGIFFNKFKVTHRSFVKLDPDPQKNQCGSTALEIPNIGTGTVLGIGKFIYRLQLQAEAKTDM